MDKLLKHSDCRNFAPVDVAKGICRIKNELIFIDSSVCNKFVTLPKCKNCSNFVPDKDHMGTCKGFKDNYWAYEENIAVTCEEYAVK
ncbi:MAG: 4-hydroxyphenylacetate decarboxylase small subunit [Clostridia bacterium]|jgi:4-hydroxyphenylacetate decarboxylase small subunit|nr:4-hydroxyphenylacetate decarboxylase small subunit [Clostridia bacterium]MDN5322345.1 4-hydroxyphenylacetate decarboxylase small subunit [Clostridia bacterium]